jgi:hypothetical protein
MSDPDDILTDEELKQIIAQFETPEQVDLFLKGLDELASAGVSETQAELHDADFTEKPVDMETFLRDEYYLGIIDEVYPKLVDDLLDLFDPGRHIYLVLLGGSIGWGKSTFAEIAMARILYEVSCYRNPQKAFGMMESTKMFFANVSVTHTQAKRVIFEGLKAKIKGSEYFRSVFPFEDFATELRFPNNILVAAATQTQVLGMNTFSAAMDEANFMTITESSAGAKIRGKRVYDQAEIVFQALMRRMETRYLRRGLLPGKLLAMSSAQYPDDFIERKMEIYKDSKHALVRSYAVWDTLPADRFFGQKFYVIFNRQTGIGTIADKMDKRGLPTSPDAESLRDMKTEDEEMIEVPIEYKHDFEVDMEGSLRDLAGRATVAIEPFIMRRDKIYEMCDPNRRHGYSLYETTLRDGGYLLKDVLCEYFEEKNEAGEVIKRGWRPKVNPKARRFIHIDPAISGDAAGFVMGHVSHYEERKRIRVVQIIDVVTGEKKPIREPYSETLPVIWIDLILRIAPPPGGEIILNDVRQLVYDLRSLGFRIGLITKDTYQSKDMEQILIERGYRVEDLSVDGNIEPYNRLKMALYESRVIAYEHPTLTGELKGLEKNKKKGKVDHRPHGSKDVADGLAGVVYNCETRVIAEPVAPSLGDVESPVDDEAKRREAELRWLLGQVSAQGGVIERRDE